MMTDVREDGYVRRTMYNAQLSAKPDCVLLCQHGDDGEQFLAEYPQLARICGVDEGTLARFIAIERDAGSPELAHAIARNMVTYDNVRVDVAEILCPRAIVDPNRENGIALRPIFDRERHRRLAE